MDAQPAPSEIRAGVLHGPGIGLLLRVKAVALRNMFHQALRQRPLYLLGSVTSVALIWIGLYIMLYFTFREVRRHSLEGIVATPLIFTFFFLALTAMLAFSNAILCYGGLFKRQESAYLLATPLPARDLVLLRYVESLALSSWSLILLGLPLMLAIASHSDEPWSFYPLFLGAFVLFIPLPGALGLLLAWTIVRLAPKTPRRAMALLAAFVMTGMVIWAWRIAREPVTSSAWLNNFYDRVSIAQNALLPHTWVAKGINYAVQAQPSESAFYLFVTLANALFFSLVAVWIVSRGYTSAFARAQVSGSRSVRRSGRVIGFFAETLFAYLPGQQRLLAVKDLKSFFRDPLQWSQMAILFALLGLYAANVPKLWIEDFSGSQLQSLVSFLNLTAVSLIMATFTSRFVFPLVSLEGQQLWLLGLLPLRRSRMIMAKFLYASTITLLAAGAVMGISVYRLELPGVMAAAHIAAAAAICIGLCGVSVGVGARMPVFHEHNPARIAGGFGGTVSLLISVALVIASLVCMGVMSLQGIRAGYGDMLMPEMLGWLIAVVAMNGVAALVALRVGIKHFNRVEW
jgi:ABC-2 type transport system permease protein